MQNAGGDPLAGCAARNHLSDYGAVQDKDKRKGSPVACLGRESLSLVHQVQVAKQQGGKVERQSACHEIEPRRTGHSCGRQDLEHSANTKRIVVSML